VGGRRVNTGHNCFRTNIVADGRGFDFYRKRGLNVQGKLWLVVFAQSRACTEQFVTITMHAAEIIRLIAVLLSGAFLLAVHAATPLVFNNTTPANDLQGSLAAGVQFAQSQVIPIRPRDGDSQPHLIGLRKSLLLVRPPPPTARVGTRDRRWIAKSNASRRPSACR
jgi:hypothetical protein